MHRSQAESISTQDARNVLKKGITSDGVYPGTSKRVIHSAEMQQCLMTSAQQPLSIAHERNREETLQRETYSSNQIERSIPWRFEVINDSYDIPIEREDISFVNSIFTFFCF